MALWQAKKRVISRELIAMDAFDILHNGRMERYCMLLCPVVAREIPLLSLKAVPQHDSQHEVEEWSSGAADFTSSQPHKMEYHLVITMGKPFLIGKCRLLL